MSSASTSAMRMRNGSSRRNDPPRFFLGCSSGRAGCSSSAGPVTGEVSSGAVTSDGGRGGSAGRGGVALLLDLGLLAAQLAQIVELGTTDVAARDELDVVDDRRVHRERALDPDAEAHLADGEGL